jgi:AcrR family transcriptional regulator
MATRLDTGRDETPPGASGDGPDPARDTGNPARDTGNAARNTGEAARDTGDPVRGSAASRAAIVGAARRRFAALGYERTTIRAVAAEARIDPAMVMRYFGSKENLFLLAADFDVRLPDLTGAAPGTAGALLVGHFVDRWDADPALAALLRAAATSETVAARVRGILAAQVGPAVAALCPDPAEAPLRAGLVAAQLLGMALCRFMLRLGAVTELDRDAMVHWLGPTVQRYLTGD